MSARRHGAVLLALVVLGACQRAELHDADDLLWLLETDRRRLGAEVRLALDRLDASRVATVEQATTAALRFRLAHGGLPAEEGARVVALLRMGTDVPAFAVRGDLVWVVRFSHMVHGVTQEVWISAGTGEIRAMLPR